MREPMMGDRVRDIATQNEGVITGQLEYLWGCRQFLVHYRDKDGKPETEWYDIGRLEVLEQAVLAAVPYGAAALVGEVRVEPSYAGADKPPPRIA